MENTTLKIKENNGRNETIDLIKGFAIFLVLWGHFIQFSAVNEFDYFENTVFKFIYSFHMPLFALVSGYLFFGTLKRKCLKQVIKSKLISFFLPMLVWSTVLWILNSLSRQTFNILKLWEIFIGGDLWFLWSILTSSIILAIVVKKIPGLYKWVGILLGFFIIYMFPNNEKNLFIYPFFVLGYIWNEYGNNFRLKIKNNSIVNNKHIMCIFFILIFIIMLIFFKKNDYIYITGINIWNYKCGVGVIEHVFIDLYRYIIGMFGSISTILIIKTYKNVIPKQIEKFLVKCGKYSMQIYILQTIILKAYTAVLERIVSFIGYNIFAKNMLVYNYMITLILAILTLLFADFISMKISRNTKLSKVLFGR